MSLSIDIDAVTHVLLADGWHAVDPMPDDDEVSSFGLDSFELGTHHEATGYDGRPGGWRDFDLEYSGGSGYMFREDGRRLMGPVSAILALEVPASGRYEAPERAVDVTVDRQRSSARRSLSAGSRIIDRQQLTS